jgi:hypothetical protein
MKSCVHCYQNKQTRGLSPQTNYADGATAARLRS